MHTIPENRVMPLPARENRQARRARKREDARRTDSPTAGIRCTLCDAPADSGAVVHFADVPTFPICAACSLPDNAPCSHCRHTLIEHVGVPDVCPEFAAMADCDAPDCSCARFVRGLRR